MTGYIAVLDRSEPPAEQRREWLGKLELESVQVEQRITLEGGRWLTIRGERISRQSIACRQ